MFCQCETSLTVSACPGWYLELRSGTNATSPSPASTRPHPPMPALNSCSLAHFFFFFFHHLSSPVCAAPSLTSSPNLFESRLVPHFQHLSSLSITFFASQAFVSVPTSPRILSLSSCCSTLWPPALPSPPPSWWPTPVSNVHLPSKHLSQRHLMGMVIGSHRTYRVSSHKALVTILLTWLDTSPHALHISWTVHRLSNR